ncbi:MAG: hypothetical protein J0647_02810 [Campylobacteraceae bacterium]|nr:hypothetical protein [Campylobacteraceae bacterium]MBV5277965.1 hypothetical protein [Campylobacteraceae bacterium]
MSDIDRAKDSINNTRMYIGICITFILTIGAGVTSLYSNNNINVLFWIGLLFIVGFSILFALLAKVLHNKTDKLKDL